MKIATSAPEDILFTSAARALFNTFPLLSQTCSLCVKSRGPLNDPLSFRAEIAFQSFPHASALIDAKQPFSQSGSRKLQRETRLSVCSLHVSHTHLHWLFFHRRAPPASPLPPLHIPCSLLIFP